VVPSAGQRTEPAAAPARAPAGGTIAPRAPALEFPDGRSRRPSPLLNTRLAAGL
jgi:hypothetical protein